ncbi:MAG TPA: hypothetical protein VG758_27360 [Hyphomicrobiaceae bacterium]|jgi:hypothetical protein|nr:hypothetical protein [Hyphomicrobiaceae bacterium]
MTTPNPRFHSGKVKPEQVCRLVNLLAALPDVEVTQLSLDEGVTDAGAGAARRS